MQIVIRVVCASQSSCKAASTCAAGDLNITEASLLGGQEVIIADAGEILSLEPLLSLVQLAELTQEPGVDLGVLKNGVLRHAVLHSLPTTQRVHYTAVQLNLVVNHQYLELRAYTISDMAMKHSINPACCMLPPELQTPKVSPSY